MKGGPSIAEPNIERHAQSKSNAGACLPDSSVERTTTPDEGSPKQDDRAKLHA